MSNRLNCNFGGSATPGGDKVFGRKSDVKSKRASSGADSAERMFGSNTKAIGFFLGGEGLAFLREGWNEPEAGGVWSSGKVARLQIPHDYFGPQQENLLTVGVTGYVSRRNPIQKVVVNVAGKNVATWVWEEKTRKSWPKTRILRLSPDLIPEHGFLQVDFLISKPASPHEIGAGADIRTLGMILGLIFIEPAQ